MAETFQTCFNRVIVYVEVEVAVDEDDMVLVDLDSLALANDSSEVMETLKTPFSTLLLLLLESPLTTELCRTFLLFQYHFSLENCNLVCYANSHSHGESHPPDPVFAHHLYVAVLVMSWGRCHQRC